MKPAEDIGISLFNNKRQTLHNLLLYCQNNVPYYRNNWSFKIPADPLKFDYNFFTKKIPLLDKKTVQYNTCDFISVDYNIEDLVFESTSGTSGEPLICYKSKSEKLKHSRLLWQQRIKKGQISITDNYVRFYSFRREHGSAITSDILYKKNALHLSLFDLGEHKLEKYWSEILKFRPKWMFGVPSAFHTLAHFLHKRDLPPYSPKFIELTGEYVSDYQIDFIRSIFRCNVSNHYGAREFWAIAYGSQKDCLEILDRSCFVETVYNPEYNQKEVVITSFLNRSWPLIRYRLGDFGELVYKNEYKRSPSVGLKIINGRMASYYQMANGCRVSPILFSFLIRNYNEKEGELVILQYQIIKISKWNLQIRLVCNRQYEQGKIIQYFQEELKSRIDKRLTINCDFRNIIKIDNRTGKFRDFIDLTMSGQPEYY